MSAPTRVYAVRMSVNLVEKIDAYRRELASRHGRPCTRSDALRLLLEKGLALKVPTKVKGLDMETPKASPRRGLAIPKPPTASRITGNITDEFEPAQSEESLSKWRGLWGPPKPKKKR